MRDEQCFDAHKSRASKKGSRLRHISSQGGFSLRREGVARLESGATMAGDDGASDTPAAYANPLPPPSHPGPKSGGAGGPPPATPMTNSDFRKLLATPRAGGGARGAAAGRRGGDGEFKRPAAKPKPRPRPKKPEDPTGLEGEASAYRDRAKERREEAAPEYQGDQSGAALLPSARRGVPGLTQQDELRQLSIEESKFLGGDVAHTHLVKGLDFALLRKTRAEIAETEKDAAFAAAAAPRRPKSLVAEAKDERGGDGRQTNADDANEKDDGVFTDRPPGASSRVRLRTAVGRAAYDAATRERDARKSRRREGRVRIDERFASGRVAFAFALDARAPDAPVTTVRSASEADAFRGGRAFSSRLMASRDARALRKVADAIAGALARGVAVAGAAGDAKKARKRAARAAAVAAAAAAAEAAAAAAEALARRGAKAAEDGDEDIFGDAGRTYVPKAAPKAPKANSEPEPEPERFGSVPTPASYFGGAREALGSSGSAGRSAPRVVVSAEPLADADDFATRDDGVTGPMPAPPAPDFASVASFEAAYAAYVRAGRGGAGAKPSDATDADDDGARAEFWDAGAASEFLRTCPDFALALTAHSVAAQAAREAKATAQSAKSADEGKKRPGATEAPRRAPAAAADAAAALERRAEASLAPDDGYGECYAGGAIGHGAFYASDDEDDPDGGNARGEGTRGAKEEAKARRGASGAKDAAERRREEEEKSRKRKLDVELGSLQRVMREKYGDKVDVAFEDKRGEKRAGEEEGGESGEGGDAARRARGKRVRL